MRTKFAVISAVSLVLFTSCGQRSTSVDTPAKTEKSMPLEYADQFAVDFLDDGCSLITIGSDEYLLVPEGGEVPENSGGAAVIRQPLENIYVAASAAMDLFNGIDGLDSVTMTSTDSRNWTIPDIAEAVESGEIAYIGKYSMPDYEALVETDCGLAIENTMIYHTPETKEKIEQLGIPVLVERSSYESHPLGRMEWIKLYGLLIGKYEEAERFFAEKTAVFNDLPSLDIPEEQRKTAAFFYVGSGGYMNVRKPGDYITKMIELAGGRYIFTADDLNVDDNALSTMNIQIETFYELAKDADILIYNSTIERAPESIDDMVKMCDILGDFKAVKSGDVWCTEQNMFQQTTGEADMMTDLSRIFGGTAEDSLTYLHRLE
ncbi:MAG: ABC transporter substrate-binding protein [Ruminococcus sp.]|nr:ABC transporter substrate-binding protein [Ruminococcus sp.]